MQEVAQNLKTHSAVSLGALNIPFFAVSTGASIESFYRSGMNAFINASLTGVRGAFFPNMHIQLPIRVAYINGFKASRILVDRAVPANASTSTQLLAAVTPGVLMTPISSVLEACNAGHMNPEPLATRWIRGIVPRGGREIIFGVGLNQMTDKVEAAYAPSIENAALCNMAASLTAGVVSGYLSHVPHNMSTLKLMKPKESYSKLFWEYCKSSEAKIPASVSASMRKPLSAVLACVLPKGCIVRTGQIVGSFVILNGTIFALKDYKFGK